MTDAEQPDTPAAPEADNGAADTHVWPFHTEAEALKAAEKCLSGKIFPHQRRKLLDRLWISYDFADAFAPLFASKMHMETISVRHTYLDAFNSFLDHGATLRDIAESIARQMSDSNFALREKAANLLVRMGKNAELATVRAIGMLRSPMPDVQLNSLRLLAAIGPQCAEYSLPKIELLLRGNITGEVRNEAEKTLGILRGEIIPEPETSEEADDAPMQFAAEFLAAAPYPHLFSKQILVIDDNSMMCEMLQSILEEQGVSVTTAMNPAAIDEVLGDNAEFDLALVGLFLGETTGAQVIRKIRAHAKIGKIPVYVVSANQDRRIMLALAQFNISGYILKPFGAKDLLVRLNTALKD